MVATEKLNKDLGKCEPQSIMGMPCTPCKVLYVSSYPNPSFGPFVEVCCSTVGFSSFLCIRDMTSLNCHPFSPVFTHLYRSLDMFLECFHSRLTQKELMTCMQACMQAIVDAGGCNGSKHSDPRDRGLVSWFNSDLNLK